jgi:hypothetical protein
MKGYIYVVSNRAYPGLVKIGKARLPKARLRQLSGATGVLYPFRAEAIFKSADYTADEKRAHRKLDAFRITPRKEFFRLPATQAITELTTLFGEAQYTRAKHKAALEACRIQAQERQEQENQRLATVRLQRQQEVEMIKKQRRIKTRRLIVGGLLAAFVILLGARWLCFPTL